MHHFSKSYDTTSFLYLIIVDFYFPVKLFHVTVFIENQSASNKLCSTIVYFKDINFYEMCRSVTCKTSFTP